MKTKEFREIQVSSTLLVVIFLCVLVLGVFIFLLGVSVGKKQVQITAANQVVAQQIQEPAKDQGATKPLDQETAKDAAAGLAPAGIQGAASGEGQSARQGGTASKPAATKPAAQETQKAAPKTTPAPAPKTAAKTSPPASSGTYFVQVAAFTDKAQATAEADKFRKRGFPVVVADPRPTDTKTWYRVRVGGYPTREKAAEILTKLNEAAKKKTDYRIIKD
jgi:cell division septation protein DedD